VFDFIWPSAPGGEHPSYDALEIALAAPEPYVARNALTRHMDEALTWTKIDLDLRNHVNLASGRGFDVLSYYADDPDVLAWCTVHGTTYLATLGAAFVRRLAKVSQRIGDAVLPLAPRTEATTVQRVPVARDSDLGLLLDGDAEVSEAEALQIAATWPPADVRAAQLPLGAFALFNDLLRLVWLHEWAHALCGHVALAKDQLGLATLHEFAADRAGDQLVEGLGFPRHEVLQALEMHADEFAVRYCVGKLLWGQDPVGDLAGPNVNLVERLVIFNLACCAFAVMWESAEQRYQPGMTFYPSREAEVPEEDSRLFVTYPTSHPPAALRYLRFRGFQRDLAMDYALREPQAARLPTLVDSLSWRMLEELGELDPRFFRLRVDTPMVARTPEMTRLEAYEAHLLKIGAVLGPFLEKTGFVPTSDPRSE
jgi:hypothetical protein